MLDNAKYRHILKRKSGDFGTYLGVILALHNNKVGLDINSGLEAF